MRINLSTEALARGAKVRKKQDMFAALAKYADSYRRWIVAASVVVFLLAVVAASVAILLIWGASALAMWGIDKLRREEATVEAGYRWDMAPLWPASAHIPLDESAEQLRRRWASTGKRIAVSTRLTENA